LTSISQLQFWRDRRTAASGYLGILSVDLGEMHKVDDSEPILAALLAANAADRIERVLDARAGLENPSDPLVDGMAELARRCADGAWRMARKASDIVREHADDEPRWRTLRVALDKLLDERFDPSSTDSIASLVATARERTEEARVPARVGGNAASRHGLARRSRAARGSDARSVVRRVRGALARSRHPRAPKRWRKAMHTGTTARTATILSHSESTRFAKPPSYLYDAAARSLGGKTA
jgi:hypothetical protein